jgi:adenylate cyclase
MDPRQWLVYKSGLSLLVARRFPGAGIGLGAILRDLVPYAAALGLLLSLRQSGITERVNLLAYDLAVQLRPAPSGASTAVRIIGINEADLNRYGPLIADQQLADAVERLDRFGVRAIGLDLFCERPVGAGWRRLRRLARTNPRLVSIYFELDGKRAIPGTPPDRQAYADLYTDPQDGLVRRDLLHVSGGHRQGKVSLPMRLLQIATGSNQLLRRLEQQPTSLAGLEEGSGGYLPEAAVSAPGYLQQMLAYHQPGSFPSWNLGKLLGNQLSPEQVQQLRGSIVLIGMVAPSSKDNFTVPFSHWRQGERQFQIPGVEIHAHRLAALLALAAGQQLGIQAAPAAVNVLLLLLAIGAGVISGEAVPSLRRSLGLVAATLLLAVGATAALLAMGVWLDAALPLATFALLAAAAWSRRAGQQQIKGLLLEREGKHVRSLFDRFVSKQVVGELLENSNPPPEHPPANQPPPDQPPQAMELRKVTVLMSDLRGFSLLSQNHHPSIMVRILNIYLAVVFDVIEEYGGTIDEVLGDSILVIFGAPLVREDHAESAIACALAMQLAMEMVNQTNADQGLPLIEMGIGLCTGDVVAGTIGSRLRAKYGVVGAAVNLAARIEALTIGGEVLASQSTVNAVAAPLRIDAEYQVEVKGSSEPLQVVSIGSISGTHNLALPIASSTPYTLEQSIEISYCLIKENQREGSPQPALVTQLAERECWIVLPAGHLKPFDNLVLSFPGIGGDAYGKVREQLNGNFHIMFSVMPTELKQLICSLRPADAQGLEPVDDQS